MAWGALGPQPHQIGNQAYFRSGASGGPTLLARRVFFAGTASDVPPARTVSATIRAVGSGAGGNAAVGSGGGGAFSRAKVPCTPASIVSITTGAGGLANSNGNASSVSIDGNVACLADGGATTLGGRAANCIGDVSYSGGNPNQDGVNGGRRGADGGQGGGGGSAGERNATDVIVLGGDGASSSGATTGVIVAGFPGGGGTRNSNTTFPGAAGVVYVEYWSA